MYDDKNHVRACAKRHQLVTEDEPRAFVATEPFTIRFRILHVYSPMHFKVQITAQKFGRDWIKLNSQSKIVDIFVVVEKMSEKCQEKLMRFIFERLCDPNETFHYCIADVYLKLEDIYFVIMAWHALVPYYEHSSGILRRLDRMVHQLMPEASISARALPASEVRVHDCGTSNGGQKSSRSIPKSSATAGTVFAPATATWDDWGTSNGGSGRWVSQSLPKASASARPAPIERFSTPNFEQKMLDDEW